MTKIHYMIIYNLKITVTIIFNVTKIFIAVMNYSGFRAVLEQLLFFLLPRFIANLHLTPLSITL